MTRIPLAEAQLRLTELIASLQAGEEVQIFSGDSFAAARSADRTVARLIAEPQPPCQPRQPSSAIGTLTILSDDQTHLKDFRSLETDQIIQSLVATGVVTPPPHRDDVERVSEEAWRELTQRLETSPGKPLSEIIIEERGSM